MDRFSKQIVESAWKIGLESALIKRCLREINKLTSLMEKGLAKERYRNGKHALYSSLRLPEATMVLC